MEPETEAPPPIRPAPEGRPGGSSFAFVRNALLVGLFALLCILASDLLWGNYFSHISGPPGPNPWWIQLTTYVFFSSCVIWIASMSFALERYTSSKMGCGGSISLLGVLNITVAIIVFFVWLLTFLAALGGA